MKTLIFSLLILISSVAVFAETFNATFKFDNEILRFYESGRFTVTDASYGEEIMSGSYDAESYPISDGDYHSQYFNISMYDETNNTYYNASYQKPSTGFDSNRKTTLSFNDRLWFKL